MKQTLQPRLTINPDLLTEVWNSHQARHWEMTISHRIRVSFSTGVSLLAAPPARPPRPPALASFREP